LHWAWSARRGWPRPGGCHQLREELFRSVAAFPPGSRFDIRFRVSNAATAAVVLESKCYEFTVSL